VLYYCGFTGHEKHEYTSGCAIQDVFAFLEEKLPHRSGAAVDDQAHRAPAAAVAGAAAPSPSEPAGEDSEMG